MSGYIFPVGGNDWRISSGFGPRSSPGGIGSTNHQGVDIAAPLGTSVLAPIDGTVIFSGRAGGYGNFIKLKGRDGNVYEFGHLSSRNVKNGQSVVAGSLLGGVGSTGNSTGNHLHYGVIGADGKRKNPSNFLNGAKNTLGTLAKGPIGKAAAGFLAGVIGGPLAPVIAGSLPGISGLMGGESWLDQFRNWLAESHFWQRLGIGLLAIIFIMGALYMLGQRATK